MKVIIVGASGRIGSQVTKALHKRHEVIQVGRKSGDIQCDYTNEQSVRGMFQKPVNLMRISFHIGVCLHKLEQYAQARQKLEQALEYFPEDGRVHYQLALTCDALGLPQEARLHYSQARATRNPGPSQ